MTVWIANPFDNLPPEGARRYALDDAASVVPFVISPPSELA